MKRGFPDVSRRESAGLLVLVLLLLPARASDDFGARVIAGVMQGRGQQRTLARFVRALRNEWDRFYRDLWQHGGRERSAALAAAQELWDRELEPVLLTFLADQALAGGTVFLSPAIGGEGRVLARAPDNTVDNLAAVQSGSAPGVTGSLAATADQGYA